jgi:uncharacterized membrane protein YqjE
MRGLKAAEQLSLALVFLGLGASLFTQEGQTTLLLAGLGLMSVSEFARWILEDSGKLERPLDLSRKSVRLLRITSPRFWAFPFYLVLLSGTVPLPVAGLGLVTLTILHIGLLWLSRN